jgi:hypothetical protein
MRSFESMGAHAEPHRTRQLVNANWMPPVNLGAGFRKISRIKAVQIFVNRANGTGR